MIWEIWFVIVLLIFALVSFLLEKIPTDQTAIMVFCGIVLGGVLFPESRLPDLNTLLTVFSSPAPLTIAAMFILSAALSKCGAIEVIATALGKMAGLGYRRFLLVLMVCVAVISAFINNTPVVMVFMPVVLSLSRSLGVPASKLLIPLSFASIFGGSCTLVGTSTNILASGIIEDAGLPPLGMFEIAALGLPLLVLGCIYLTLFGDRLLPHRETLTSLLSDAERKEFLTEAYIQKESPLVGKEVARSGLLKTRGVRLVELIRDDVSLSIDVQKEVLHEGDRLVLSCRPSGIAHARSIEGLGLSSLSGIGLETISAHEGAIVEGVIGPKSTIVGQTLREIGFRQRFRMILMAIHRRGVNLRDKIDNIPLQSGDLLLMMGTEQAIERMRASDDILLLDHPPTPSLSLRKKTPVVVATVAAVIIAASLNLMPIAAAALIGVAVILASGCLTPKEGYANIEWSILVLIFGMLGLGTAMQTTGAADLLAQVLSRVADFDFISADIKPYVVLAALYLATMLMTETLSNNATVVLMTPIALSLGGNLDVDPRPFIIAACLASSASFSTPIGYQTNTYVYGVGGYRFADFTRIGVPLNLMYFVISVFMIPRIWSF